jgi:hypothetical protein
LILSIGAANLFAWDDEGHMAIAYLAYQRLTPATRKRVDVLLKLNPHYAKWLAMVPKTAPPVDVNRFIFQIAATWPDQIRTDPAYSDDGSRGGNMPDGPNASQNIGYQDHLRHKYWHFIDIPFSQDNTQLPAIPAPNAQTQIAAFRAALASNRSDDVKSYDLVWLEHLVGDIHQPLHAVMRVTKDIPDGDAGGSLVPVCAAPCTFTLHLFWDRLVGSQSALRPPAPPDRGGPQPQVNLAAEAASAVRAARTLPAPRPDLVARMDGAVWVRESFEAAKQYVYRPPVGECRPYCTLTQAYYDAARTVARDRAAFAAARLANLLNRELH